jgi:hypothetical protein
MTASQHHVREIARKLRAQRKAERKKQKRLVQKQRVEFFDKGTGETR